MWTWGRRGGGSWRRPPPTQAPPTTPPPRAAHLNVGLREQLNDAGVGRGHHTLPVDLNDAVPHADAPALGNATPEEAADLRGQEGPRCPGGHAWGRPPPTGSAGWGLTMPSSTQKPSCSRTWGRRMMAVVTGGQWTMLRVTSV